MSLDLKRVVETARAADRRDAAVTEARQAVEYAVPTFAVELTIGILVAALALLVLRSRRGYHPEWVRRLFGVQRTLRHRADLKPKRLPLHRVS